MNILFVCTGNTCRSPMAEGIAKRKALELGLNCNISSAGLSVMDGELVSENSVAAMNEIGIDISGHIPRQLNQDIISNADYIIPMTASHKLALLSSGCEKQKIIEFEDQISDPYGGDLDCYRRCRDQLLIQIKPILEKLL